MVKPKHIALSDEHHVIRKCGRQKQVRDERGNVIGINPGFFALRSEIGEDYLSCSWFEYFPGDDDERLRSAYDYMRVKMRGWKDALLAKSNVLKIKDCAQKRGYTLKVRHTPNKKDPAYTKISGLPLDNSDQSLLDALANEVATQLFPLPSLL